jgi:hypothetical protein
MFAKSQVFTNWEREYEVNKALFSRAAEMNDYGDKLFSLHNMEKPKSEKGRFFKEYSEKLNEPYRATMVISSALRIAYKSDQPGWEKAELLNRVCSNVSIEIRSIPVIDELDGILEQRILTAWGLESRIETETIKTLSNHLKTRYEIRRWLSKTCVRAANPKNWQ